MVESPNKVDPHTLIGITKSMKAETLIWNSREQALTASEPNSEILGAQQRRINQDQKNHKDRQLSQMLTSYTGNEDPQAKQKRNTSHINRGRNFSG